MEDPMICPKCLVPMNHHAEKVDYSTEGGDGGLDKGMIVIEIHTCPHCGETAARPAQIDSGAAA